MRKLEEEMFRNEKGIIDRKAWVKHHKFPEDTIREYNEKQGLKTTKGYDTGHCRCVKCNYSTSGLHDDLLVYSTGRRKKRMMFRSEIRDVWLCSYCYYPDSQWHERHVYEAARAELSVTEEFKKITKIQQETSV